jgi:hypothetical protein
MTKVLDGVFAIASVAAIFCVVHYAYMCIIRPEKLLLSRLSYRLTRKKSAYHVAVFIGAAVFGYAGAHSLLSWLPDSIGGITGYENYLSIRSYIAIVFGFLCSCLAEKGEDFARDNIYHTLYRIKAEELEKITTYTLPNLRYAIDEYRKKANEAGKLWHIQKAYNDLLEVVQKRIAALEKDESQGGT